MSWPRPPGPARRERPPGPRQRHWGTGGGDKATPSPGPCSHTQHCRFLADSFLFFPFPEVLPRARAELGAWQAGPWHEVMPSARSGTNTERGKARWWHQRDTRPCSSDRRERGQGAETALGALGRDPAGPAGLWITRLGHCSVPSPVPCLARDTGDSKGDSPRSAPPATERRVQSGFRLTPAPKSLSSCPGRAVLQARDPGWP